MKRNHQQVIRNSNRVPASAQDRNRSAEIRTSSQGGKRLESTALSLNPWDWRKSEMDNEGPDMSIDFTPQEAEMIDLSIKQGRCVDLRDFVRRAVLRLANQAKIDASGSDPLVELEHSVAQAIGLLGLLTTYLEEKEHYETTETESEERFGMFHLSIATRERLRKSFNDAHKYALGAPVPK
jgi:hypothetical protein